MILPFAISLLSWLSPFCLIKSVSVAGLVIRYVAVFCHLIPELLGNAALKDNGDGIGGLLIGFCGSASSILRRFSRQAA